MIAWNGSIEEQMGFHTRRDKENRCREGHIHCSPLLCHLLFLLSSLPLPCTWEKLSAQVPLYTLRLPLTEGHLMTETSSTLNWLSQSHGVGNHRLLLQWQTADKDFFFPLCVHSAQVSESFCWQNTVDYSDYEEDTTILDCVQLFLYIEWMASTTLSVLS